MFMAILAVLVFSAFYEPYFLRKMFGSKKRVWPFQILTLLFLAGYFALVASGASTKPSYVVAFLYDFLGLFFIFQVYLFFYLRLVQLICLLRKLLFPSAKKVKVFSPKPLLKKQAIFGLLLCAGLVIYGAIEARSFIVTEHEIALPNLKREVRVLHAPDLHLGASRGEAYLETILAAVAELKPDIIFYNGDMVDSRLALKPEIFDQFKNLPAEQYFTTGNHEYYVGVDEVVDMVKNAGIVVLRSQLVDTHGIQFIGLEYMNADPESTDAHQVNALAMSEELPKIASSSERPIVVIHHSPVGMKYASAYGAKAMLSGHTHGGQVFPGTLIIKSRFPMYKGRYKLDDMVVLVSQGAGTFGPMLRLGTENEIQLVRFVPAQ
ncbi:MAG: metallophosphoesterase [Deltaproteobacteria bacterium]|jgi:predicted MPP superfamily phosphohydrolase|nr:metallophosphoesterase [Deltaproteobacteria bacterium]